MKYVFFYDESEHSRKITQSTVSANNFAENFVAAIIGYSVDNAPEIEKAYSSIEEKYNKFYGIKELKSQIIPKNRYEYGLFSFKKKELELLDDIITFCIENDLKLYLSVQNKIHYLIIQMLSNYRNTFFFDADALAYSTTKFICTYKPKEVIEAIYKDDLSFVKELKKFCRKLLNHNGKLEHKEIENLALEQILMVLDDYNYNFTVDWEYGFSFYGFKKYLVEQGIDSYQLIIDQEGKGSTKNAAINENINAIEADSKDVAGIRMADFIAGIVSRFIISISNSLAYKSLNENISLKLLDNNWFNIDAERFNIYKKLKVLIVSQNDCWDKIFCNHFADSLIYFISLLNYISLYKSYDEFKKCNTHASNLNICALNDLQWRFELMASKLEVEPVSAKDEIYYNQRGALCYKDYTKHSELQIDEKGEVYYVLSVGFFGKNEKACVTIKTDKGPVVYLLPDPLLEWAFTCVSYANRGVNMFPSKVKFILINGRYCADIL